MLRKVKTLSLSTQCLPSRLQPAVPPQPAAAASRSPAPVLRRAAVHSGNALQGHGRTQGRPFLLPAPWPVPAPPPAADAASPRR